MKLGKRYNRLTCWMDYQSCCERLEDEDGRAVPWWGELTIAVWTPLLFLIIIVIERFAPGIGQR